MIQKIFPKLSVLICLIVGLAWISQDSAQSQIFGNGLLSQPKENNFVLSWSTDSYVPLNYQGKALPSRGSEVRVVAEPIKKLAFNPEKFNYRWLLDDDIVGFASGLGKMVFHFPVTQWAGNAHEVTLKILDENENLVETHALSIKIVESALLLTKQDSFYALKDTLFASAGQEIKFLAVPLFFSIKKLSEINWQWVFAGQKLSSPDDKDLNILVLKIPKANLSQVVKKNLLVNANNKTDQFQGATVDLDIEIK